MASGRGFDRSGSRGCWVGGHRFYRLAVIGDALEDLESLMCAVSPCLVIAEGHREPTAGQQFGRVHDLHVHVRLGGVSRVAALGNGLTHAD